MQLLEFHPNLKLFASTDQFAWFKSTCSRNLINRNSSSSSSSFILAALSKLSPAIVVARGPGGGRRVHKNLKRFATRPQKRFWMDSGLGKPRHLRLIAGVLEKKRAEERHLETTVTGIRSRVCGFGQGQKNINYLNKGGAINVTFCIFWRQLSVGTD